MRGSKCIVKWLDAEFSRVLFETIGIHQRNRSQPAHVGVVKSSAVVEIESERGIIELRSRECAIVDQQRARESWLDDDSVTGVEIDHHQLGAPPAAKDGRIAQPPPDRAGAHLTHNIRFPNRNLRSPAPSDRAVEVARDRLRLRQFGHRASPPANLYRGAAAFPRAKPP